MGALPKSTTAVVKSLTSDQTGIKISLSFYLNASFSDQLNARIAKSLKHVVDGWAVHLCDGWWHFVHPGLHDRSPPEGWRLHVNHTTSRHLNKKLVSDLVTVLTSNEGLVFFFTFRLIVKKSKLPRNVACEKLFFVNSVLLNMFSKKKYSIQIKIFFINQKKIPRCKLNCKTSSSIRYKRSKRYETYCGRGGDFQIHGFKHEIGGVCQLDDFTAHQTQLLIVI